MYSKDILIVLVNFNNDDEILDFIVELNKQTVIDKIAIAIVHNSKVTDDKANYISNIIHEQYKFKVYQFFPENNLGYFNGFVFGYKSYLRLGLSKPKYLIFTNTDILFRTINVIEDCINYIDNDVWMVGPSVYNYHSDSYANPKFKTRVPKIKIFLSILIHSIPIISHWYLRLARKKASKNKKSKSESGYVYGLQGCFIVINSKFFQSKEFVHYKAFLFAEENYLAEQVRINNKRCYYNSDVEIIHNEMTSTKKLGYRKRAKWYRDSHMFILSEFYSKDGDY